MGDLAIGKQSIIYPDHIIDIWLRFHIFSLEEIILEENRLYLIFEFLYMDLKKYIDTVPDGELMNKELVSELFAVSFP